MKIVVKNITKEYIKGWHILRNVSLEFSEGNNLLLSIRGGGKSTLLRIMLGLDKDFCGEVFFDEKNLKSLTQRDLDAMFVSDALFLKGNKTVKDNVKFGLTLRGENNFDSKIDEILLKVGLDEKINEKIKNLNEEEKFFVAVARGLVRQPKVIVFDDVFINFDEEKAKLFTEKLFSILNDFNAIKIFSTESLELAKLIDGQKIYLNNE